MCLVLYRSHDLDHNHLNRLLRRKLSVRWFLCKTFLGKRLKLHFYFRGQIWTVSPKIQIKWTDIYFCLIMHLSTNLNWNLGPCVVPEDKNTLSNAHPFPQRTFLYTTHPRNYSVGSNFNPPLGWVGGVYYTGVWHGFIGSTLEVYMALEKDL